MDSDASLKVEARKLLRQHRRRVSLFVSFAVLVAILLSSSYEAILTSGRLERVERQRDQWQRPDDVIEELDLKEDNVVADLGSGVGYFALKLSDAVGSGKVLASIYNVFRCAFCKSEHS